MRRVPIAVAATVIAVVLAVGSFTAGVRVSQPEMPEGFAPVLEAARDLRARAARQVSAEELSRAAIEGMLEALEDPYAALLAPEETRQVHDLVSGSFVGIGVWLEEAERGLRITTVLEGSPAERAGLKSGDVIVAAGGRQLRDVSLERATRILRGPEGSTIRVVVRAGEGRREVTLRRARMSIAQVEARMVRGSVAYLRPLRFSRGTAREVRSELERLLRRGADGVVLDLRGNSGGLADEAVRTASLFLDGGLVATIRERSGAEERLHVRGTPVALREPVAVLVDGGTASASELVAGALRDRGRGTLVGITTFGKGSVLTVEGLGDAGPAIQFTSAFFFTPGGHRIEGRGLAPDVAVLPGGPDDAQLDRAVRVVLERR